VNNGVGAEIQEDWIIPQNTGLGKPFQVSGLHSYAERRHREGVLPFSSGFLSYPS